MAEVTHSVNNTNNINSSPNKVSNSNTDNNISTSADNGEELIDKVSTETFLNFLSTAYKLNSLLENADLNQQSTPTGFDLSQINELNQQAGCADQFSLKLKLTQVLNEGLLDSILPYLIPPSKFNHNAPSSTNSTQPVIKKTLLDKSATSGASVRKCSGDASATKRKHRGHTPQSDERGKTGAAAAHSGHFQGKDIEVEIHVCDEVKNLKRDFKCSQKLLVSKMGYFAQVTMGQRLEDMDISVHCDINIFEWLMRWVKKDSGDKSTGNRAPELDCCNVIAVLVSANFLQMEPLLLDCLHFCKLNMNEIIRSSNNLVCINDSVLSRIAHQFSNIQVEDLEDRKDKIRSRLFCKLIFSLNEWPPVSARGHWASTGRLYRCLHCGSLLSATYAGRIACKPNRMSIDSNGNLVFSHEKDATWSLTEHIRSLRSQLKDWGRIYWKLWSQCHLLSCVLCNQLYPVCDSLSCAYHPQAAQFSCLDSAKLLQSPIGRYPCCGGQAFRYEALHNFQGCHFKPHVPRTVLPAEASIQKTVERVSDQVCVEPPPSLYPPERRLARVLSLTSGGAGDRGEAQQTLWWRGLALIPTNQRTGLLRLKNKGVKGVNSSSERSSPDNGTEDSFSTNTEEEEEESSDEDDNEDQEQDFEDEDEEEGDEESGSEGEEEVVKRIQRRGKGGGHGQSGTKRNSGGMMLSVRSNKHKTTSIRHWTPKQSTRCNQDNQRETEESLFQNMAGQLVHQSHHMKPFQYSTYLGGAYVKLEQEWKDSVRQTPPPMRNKYRRNN
uniref:Uncharacterized protein KIAA1841 homolog n=2 Tax=Cacopsylla melanoneura TaxID=428564 RepID=A0A8D8XBH6_9HEMI